MRSPPLLYDALRRHHPAALPAYGPILSQMERGRNKDMPVKRSPPALDSEGAMSYNVGRKVAPFRVENHHKRLGNPKPPL